VISLSNRTSLVLVFRDGFKLIRGCSQVFCNLFGNGTRLTQVDAVFQAFVLQPNLAGWTARCSVTISGTR
jgi:hypothetical protein